MSRGYKDFDIYKTAHRLAIGIHHISLKLPKNELYETESQIRRSSKSVSANIVEGYGRRRYHAEYIRFLIFSQTSCDETIEWLEYIADLYTLLEQNAKILLEEYEILGRKMTKFIQAIENR